MRSSECRWVTVYYLETTCFCHRVQFIRVQDVRRPIIEGDKQVWQETVNSKDDGTFCSVALEKSIET